MPARSLQQNVIDKAMDIELHGHLVSSPALDATVPEENGEGDGRTKKRKRELWPAKGSLALVAQPNIGAGKGSASDSQLTTRTL